MGSVTYINPGGLRVTIPASLCEYATACLLSFRLSFVGKWDPVRPGDDKVEESLHRGQ
jgi:hypothetical protein